MTNSKIKQELRRSACEDVYPWTLSRIWAAEGAVFFCDGHEYIDALSTDDQRTFFLLVAEAL